MLATDIPVERPFRGIAVPGDVVGRCGFKPVDVYELGRHVEDLLLPDTVRRPAAGHGETRCRAVPVPVRVSTPARSQGTMILAVGALEAVHLPRASKIVTAATAVGPPTL